MAKQSFTAMSVDALLKLRGDLNKVLSRRADELKGYLSRMEGGRPRSGAKIAPKYRGPNGETWAGRGAQPRWMTAEIKRGKKREQFLINKTGIKKRPLKRRAAKK
jgi:DNA-binding protein H-NS